MKQFGQRKKRMGLRAIIFATLMLLGTPYLYSEQPANLIVGKWISSQGNVIVEIFKEINTYKARIIWFNDSDDKSNPMNSRTDRANPDLTLRDRKVIGLVVLRDLAYNAKNNRWEHGKIYDVQTGKEWDSSVWITKEGLLKVKGFWHVELFGKTMTFKRAK